MATSLKELIVTYQANAQPVLNALNKVDSHIRKTSQSLTTLGSSFKDLGQELSLALSLPFVLFTKSSVSALADIQSLEAGLSSILEKFNTGLPIEEAATKELDFLRQTADELGVSFRSITRSYIQYLASSNDSLETSRKVIKSFLGVGSALGMSSAQVELMVKALQQMQSKTKISAEELKGQLGDTMPGAIKLFADSVGVGTKEFLQMMEQGKISSTILSDVADTINKKWGSAIDKGSKTIRANMNRVVNALYQVRIEVGKGLDEFVGLNNKLEKLSNWLNNLAKNFNRLDYEGKKIILSLGIFLIVIGPLILVLGTFSRLIGILWLGLRSIIISINFLIGLLPVLFGTLRRIMLLFAANPLGAFLIATVLIITYWRKIVDLFKKAKAFVGKFIPTFKEIKDRQSKIDYSPTNYKPLFDSISSGIVSSVGSLNNFLAERNLLPESFLKGGAYNQPMNNQKVVNNNLTVNIPQGTSSTDSESIKSAIKAALSEENRQSYIEVGAQ